MKKGHIMRFVACVACFFALCSTSFFLLLSFMMRECEELRRICASAIIGPFVFLLFESDMTRAFCMFLLLCLPSVAFLLTVKFCRDERLSFVAYVILSLTWLIIGTLAAFIYPAR